MKLCFRSFAALAAGLLACNSFAATYYVSPTGNDSNAGTSDAPVATIKKGVALATADGDIVSIADGDYEIGTRITVSQAITIQGNVADCSKVVVNCKNVAQSFYTETADGLTIEGISFTNISRVVQTRKLLTVRHCAFRQGPAAKAGAAVTIDAGESGTTTGDGRVIEDCVFEDISTDGKGPVYIAGANTCKDFSLVIRRCVFRDCSGTNNGGAIGQNTDGALTLDVENCEFSNCSASGAGGAVALQKNSGKVSVFRNCLFAQCSSMSANYNANGSVIYAKSDIRIENSTFADCQCPNYANSVAAAVYLYNGGGTITLANCVFWNNTDKDGALRDVYPVPTSSSPVTNCATQVATAATSFSQTVGFKSLSASPFAAPGVYTLAPIVDGAANPCIDGGTVLDWMTGAKDLAGADRIINSVPDIGAYEYGGVVKLPAGFLMYLD